MPVQLSQRAEALHDAFDLFRDGGEFGEALRRPLFGLAKGRGCLLLKRLPVSAMVSVKRVRAVASLSCSLFSEATVWTSVEEVVVACWAMILPCEVSSSIRASAVWACCAIWTSRRCISTWLFPGKGLYRAKARLAVLVDRGEKLVVVGEVRPAGR